NLICNTPLKITVRIRILNDDDNEEDDSDNDDGGNDDEGSNEDSNQTYSDDDENPSFTLKEYVEEEQYKEFVLTPERKNLMMMIRCMKREMMMSQRSWPAFNLLKGTCKSFTELEYHFKECYKAVNDRLDLYNLEGCEYLFDLSKPLPLIEVQGRQVVPANYFINNDLEYLKGGSSSSKYVTSTTRTKAAKYDNIEGIEHMKSPHDVYSKRRIIVITSVKVMRWYDFGYLEAIIIRRDDNVLYKFKGGPAFNLLKGTCKSFIELEYHFKECYKAVNDRLDLYNLEGCEYLFDLSKPLPLIEVQGCQVVPANYFINNDLEYLKGGSSSSKYATSTTRTKAAKYDNIEGIEHMVPTL
nr:hypothetical protein [Tanacetum cinerariifolium]